MTHNETSNYIASIIADDELVDIDIRTLSPERLAALRDDAGAHGDLDLVAAIDTLAL